MQAIVDALGRIDNCLNKRFEKDASLYIAQEDVDALKKQIYDGQYKQILEKLKFNDKFSAEVLANVLVKNAWLIRNKNYSVLRPIFEQCHPEYLTLIMCESVLDNKVAMPSDFRAELISIFLNRLDSSSCEEILKEDYPFLNNLNLRAKCLKNALAEKKPMEKFSLFEQYVKKYPGILKKTQPLKKIFPNEDLTDDVKKAIFMNVFANQVPSVDFWVDQLGADNAEAMFAQLKQFCRSNSSDVKKVNAVLPRLFALARKNPQKNMPLFASYFAEGCNEMDSRYKGELAKKGIERARAEEEPLFVQEIQKYGIAISQKGALASLEEIIDVLNEKGRPNSYLMVSFNKKYDREYQEALSRMAQELDYNVFNEFCCWLMEYSRNIPKRTMKYILYLLHYVIEDDATKQNPYVKRVLRHIEDNAVFDTCAGEQGIDEVRAFVKRMDFDLFCRLTSF